MVDVLLGLQWGDEGKGKIVDFLAPKYQVIARFQGGPNAGHSLEFDGIKMVLNTIPSGIFQPNCINLIGNGVVIDPVTLQKEIEKVLPFAPDLFSKLLLAHKAHLILPTHRLLDAASEKSKGDNKIGSTLRGISPSYQDKMGRSGIRIGDILAPDFKTKYEALKTIHLKIIESLDYYDFNLTELEGAWFEAIEYLKKVPIVNGEYYINNAIKEGKKVLAEGAQGTMLDIDFGTYPYVTSSNTVSAGACTGLGISPKMIGEVFGIFKAYCTRVGSGPFPTELKEEVGESLRQKGKEFGATTGRPRRTGWIDLPALKYSIMLNGVTQLIMTKADVLDGFETIKACTSYNIEGKETNEIPFDLNSGEIIPNFLEIKCWQNNQNKLSTELTDYILFLEKQL